jgi:hypothetical protein
MTDASLEMLSNLRSTENLQWYVVPLMVLIVYIYNTELEKKNWGIVLLSIYFFATSGVVLEIVNALVLHFSGYSALWTTPGRSAYVIYAGWNIEILFLAAIGGLVVLKGLPEDRHMKILGVPNRLFLSVVNATVAVFVEVLLNQVGLLVWEYKYWSWPHIYLILVWWTIPYLILVWMHDHLSLEAKRIAAVAGLAVAACFHSVFAVALKWV